MTSNQHYAGLNRRFDKRSKLLSRFGFRYVRSEELGIAAFTRRTFLGKPQTFTANFLQLADHRTWLDKLEVTLSRGF